MESSCRQGFGRLFACHMSTEGGEFACAGYLLVAGLQNFRVRLALARGRLDPDEIVSDVALYGSFAEMARANDYDPGDSPEINDAFGLQTLVEESRRG